MIKIDEKYLEKNDLSIREVIVMLLIEYVGDDLADIIDMLMAKGYAVDFYNNQRVKLSQHGTEIIKNIMTGKEAETNKQHNIELAKKMAEMFPKMLKPGTNIYFRSNAKETADKLDKFFSKFGQYTDDEILLATQKYVDTHIANNDLKTMRVLKYFIWKDEDKLDEDGNLRITRKSELADCLENLDSDDDFNLEEEMLR